ncbi:MAG: hypothetical protein ACTHME_04765 [Candidatus Nitrosocosmicus sp.]
MICPSVMIKNLWNTKIMPNSEGMDVVGNSIMITRLSKIMTIRK